MMVRDARAKSLYFLIAANFVLIVLLGFEVVTVTALHDRLNQAEERSYASCVRGNVLREAARLAMKKLDFPEVAKMPQLQRQPCAAIYPGGAPKGVRP